MNKAQAEINSLEVALEAIRAYAERTEHELLAAIARAEKAEAALEKALETCIDLRVTLAGERAVAERAKRERDEAINHLQKLNIKDK